MFSSVGRIRVTRYGNLEISSVQLVDAGTYICSWMSTDPSEIKAYAQARLSVLGEQCNCLMIRITFGYHG